MRRRELTLLDGLRIGGTVAKSVTVREGTLGDTLNATGAGHAGLRLDLAIAMARIERIGDLDAPSDGVLALMTQRDWMLIDRALLEIDAEGLRDLEAAGLLQPQGGGGRDEPGPAAPVTPPPGNA